MKARVKATGEIGIVSQIDILLNDEFVSFSPNKIELLTNYADASTKHSPDYWTRLEHQAAIAAVQGILAKYGIEPLPDDLINDACEYAHALVEKYKKEERK